MRSRGARVLAAAALASLPAAALAQPVRQVIGLRYTTQDRETGRYQYVPFQVPEGATRIRVEYRYDRAGGANVVDLGLFEPGPLELGAARCRGWSGGERQSVTITPEAATPGYRAGPLPAGRWHVQLGLYKVAEAGVEVELTIEIGRPARRGPGWFSGDLHTHTLHSDGTLTVSELARAAAAAGLDFIAITDHNNTAHAFEPAAEETPLRIVGEEVTTPAGHANVWGLAPGDWIDFRVLAGGPIGGVARAAHARGALFSINHPFAVCAGCSWEHGVPAEADAIEVWNGWNGPQPASVALWDRLLREGRRITAVGSSDWHRQPAPLGRGSVRVRAEELNAPAILEGIRRGRVVVMGDARSPAPTLEVRSGQRRAGIGDTLALRAGEAFAVEVGAAGLADAFEAALVGSAGPTRSSPLAAGVALFASKAAAPGYLRAEVRAKDGSILALTNPVFLEVAGKR
jgi:hypothetical protein